MCYFSVFSSEPTISCVWNVPIVSLWHEDASIHLFPVCFLSGFVWVPFLCPAPCLEIQRFVEGHDAAQE